MFVYLTYENNTLCSKASEVIIMISTLKSSRGEYYVEYSPSSWATGDIIKKYSPLMAASVLSSVCLHFEWRENSSSLIGSIHML